MADEIKLTLTDDTAAGAAGVEKNLDAIDAAASDAASALEKTASAVESIGEGDATLNDVVASIEKMTGDLSTQTTQVAEQQAAVNDLYDSWLHRTATLINDLSTLGHAIGQGISVTKDMAAEAKRLANEYRAVNIVVGLTEKATLRAVAAQVGLGTAVGGTLTALATAKAAHIAYNTLLANTGKSADGLTNNLTRTREANSALWDDITTTAGAGADAVKDWGVEAVANAARSIDELTGVSTAWKEVDRAMTESTNNYVNNTRVIGEAIRGVSRDAVKASKDIAKAQADAVDDFDRVRMSNEEIEQAAKNRAEAERLAALDTVEAINSELHAMQQRRGEAAAANKFSEDDQKRYVAVVGSLEQKRTDITKREADDRAKIIKQEADDRDKSDRDQAQRYEDLRNRENDKILDEYRDQARAELDARREREREVDRFIERERQKIQQEEYAAVEAVRRAADERLNILKQERQKRLDMVAGATDAQGKNLVDSARQNIDPAKLRAEYVRQQQQKARENFTFEGDDARMVGAARNKAVKDAGVQAFRDFNSGKAGQSDIVGAQNSMIQAAMQQAHARGELETSILGAMGEFLQISQANAQSTQMLMQEVNQLRAAAGQVNNTSRNTYANGRRMAFTR